MPSALLVAGAAASLLGGCGGGDEKADQAKGGPRPTKTKPVTSAVRPVVPGAKQQAGFSGSARAKIGAPVQALIRVLPQAAGQPLRIRLRQVTPKQWTVSARLSGSGPATSRITLPATGLVLSRLVYTCRLSPTTFCPVRAKAAGKKDVTLKLPGSAVPVSLTTFFDLPGQSKQPPRVKLGSPEAPVRAQLLAQALPSSGKPDPPAPRASASAGSRLRILVRPLAGSGSGKLRVSIVKAAGRRIAVETGPAGGDSVASATVKGDDGEIRLTDPSWTCTLPPATFCPITKASATKGGFGFELPMPRVPVQLLFQVQKG